MQINVADIIDCSHPIDARMPHWPGDPQTRIQPAATHARDGYAVNELCFGEHGGTHFGAPSHFVDGGATVDQFQPSDLFLPVVKLALPDNSRCDADVLLQPDDVLANEHQFGKISPDSVVLVETGWSQFWRQPEIYLGGSAELHFPGVAPDAVNLLLERRIRGLGIDTAGIDGGRSTDFAANTLLAENNCFHLENLRNLDKCPYRNGMILIGVLPIVQGHGSPCRIFVFR